jgi:hypothetical protein
MAYSKTIWVNNSTPSINATNLNKIEDGIFDVTADLSSSVASLSSSIATLSSSVANIDVGIRAGSIVYAYKNFGGAL